MTDIDIRPIENYEVDSWNALVAESRAGTIFHTSWWRDTMNAACDNGEFRLIGAFGKQGLLGGFAALTRKRLGVSTAVTPLCTPYNGFIVSDSAAVDEVINDLSRKLRGFRYQNIQCSPGFRELSQLAESGYTLTPRATLEINLRLPEDEIWKGFAGNVRRNIRKAKNADFEITDQWNAAAGWDIFRSTFTRHGQKCPVPEKLFSEISAGSTMEPYRKRYCAWSNDRLVAFIVAIRWNGKVYYELAASQAEAMKSGVASLLVWELLRDHLEGEWETFDFVGANIPAITRFKERFNPTLRNYVSAELCLSSRIRFGRGLRQLLRRK